MLTDFFLEKIEKKFTYEPTKDQEAFLEKFCSFFSEGEKRSVFLLDGYAGTGKSSLIGTIVRTLDELNRKTVLLAPTGRAAKIFSYYASHEAFTIHKKIYRQKRFDEEFTDFEISSNLHKNTLFIVDEASMVSDEKNDFSESGRLLKDLISYVYGGEGCRLVIVGDSAQLPPVGREDSPALDVSYLESFGLKVYFQVMREVVRQSGQSGLLRNATIIRDAIFFGKTDEYPVLECSSFGDVKRIEGEDLAERMESSYEEDGLGETVLITRSNKMANLYNRGIRSRILYREEEICPGDLLMISKNNYYWPTADSKMNFIANGDLIEIKRIRKIYQLYDYHFADVSAFFPDYEEEMEIRILLEALHADAPSLTKEMNDKLFYNVLEDYREIKNKRERMKKMKEDPFFNSVTAKYGYAVTCHKSQGGQWKNVFLDLSYVPKEYLGNGFYRWLYTAFTRATESIYLVNPQREIVLK